MVEPTNKKRKLQANGNGVDKQPSFTDILQQLEAEGDDSGGGSFEVAVGPSTDENRFNRDIRSVAATCCSQD